MVKNICIYRRDSVFRSIYALDHGVMDHIKHYRMVFTTSWKSAKAGWGASRTLLQEGKSSQLVSLEQRQH